MVVADLLYLFSIDYVLTSNRNILMPLLKWKATIKIMASMNTVPFVASM